MITFHFPDLRLQWDAVSGEAVARFPDGTHSGCGVTEDNAHHAERLGITPELHRLLHELAHHLVGYALYGSQGSPVVWRSAHGVAQEEGGWYKPDWSEAAREEWICELLEYRCLHKPFTEGALTHAEESGMDVDAACMEFSRLMMYAEFFSNFPYPVDIQAKPPRKDAHDPSH